MIVLKICGDVWKNASRDKRELSLCQEIGMDTMVLAKGTEHDYLRKDIVEMFSVFRVTTRPLSICNPTLNRLSSLILWSRAVRELSPDIITGENVTGILIGFLSNLFNKKKAKLIYDSHEFEIGRAANRSRFQTWCITHLERFLIKRCAFSIMVNDAIADEVQRIHKLKERPIVVRSTPNLWTVDPEICKEIRLKFEHSMEEPKETMLMYHGGVITGRGIETLIQLVAKNPMVCAVILGNGSPEYLESLRSQAKQLGVSSRILFHPAVPIEKLWKYVGAVDIGFIAVSPVGDIGIPKSYYLSLPNKFFENIQSETPIICPSYPAMQPIVEKYQIGLTCDPTDLEAINECVERLRTDRAFYQQCKENLKIAKQELCWEREKEVLKMAYDNLIRQWRSEFSCQKY